MKRRINNLIILGLVFALSLIHITYAEIVDKKGRIVYEITKPTVESTIDPDIITAADRRVVNASDESSYEGPSQNILSSGMLFYEKILSGDEQQSFTLIRHTPSITDLTYEKYFLNQDDIKDRLRLMIVTSDGFIEGKDGFYKMNGKTYYFDTEGLMVLGPCFDTIGNYYFFSYETGELLEEIQKR